MDMTVNQSRAEKCAFHIQGLLRRIISEADDEAVPDGDIRPLDLPGEDIDHPSIFDQEIDFTLA
jgi:hypothetical protein